MEKIPHRRRQRGRHLLRNCRPAPSQRQRLSHLAKTTPAQQGPTEQTILSISPANDAARYLAGLPVAFGSRLAVLTQEPSWQAYAMNQAFSQLDKRQLNNIRTFRAENIAPVTLHRTD
jgi:hypothetical protein